MKKFRKIGIQINGFRAPLRFSDETSQAVTESGIFWSSQVAIFFGNNPAAQQVAESPAAQRLFDFYTLEHHKLQPSIPYWENLSRDPHLNARRRDAY